jgi:hypothetical protein
VNMDTYQAQVTILSSQSQDDPHKFCYMSKSIASGICHSLNSGRRPRGRQYDVVPCSVFLGVYSVHILDILHIGIVVMYPPNTRIVGSNPTQGMCMRLFCLCVVLSVGADHSSKESYRLCKKRLRN